LKGRANRLLVMVVGAVALLAPACADFPDVSAVIDLRVLAVRTEPSEVILRLNGLPTDPASPIDPAALTVDPASIPTITVTPLFVDPPALAAGRAVTWSLVACPNNPYGAAPPGGMAGNAADPSGGARTTVGSNLCGEGAPTTWTLGGPAMDAGMPFDVALTPDQLLAAFKADIYLDQDGQPHGGFDLGLPMNLQLTATDGVQTVAAIKRVLFWATMLPGQMVNQTPTIPHVRAYRDRDPQTWDPVGAVTPVVVGIPETVPVGTSLWLEPELPPEMVESYVTTVIDRNPPHRAIPAVVPRERIRYAFYATAGKFDPPRTVSEQIPGVTGPVHLESKYVPPAALEDVPPDAATGKRLVTVWIVVRDDRGGESWVQEQIELLPMGTALP
jgi:hypothetical protein